MAETGKRTLPNGAVVRNIPVDLTDEQLQADAIANGWAKESDYSTPEESTPEEEKSFLGNVVAGAGERGADILGNLGEFGDDLSKEFGVQALRMYGASKGVPSDTNKLRERFKESETDLGKFSQGLKDADLGYKERHTWEQVKENPLHYNTLLYSAEQMGKSVPDMLGILTMPMIYAIARIEEMGDQRAVNHALSRLESGASEAEIEEALASDADWMEKTKAAPAVAASLLLERIALSRLIKPKKIKSSTKKATALAVGGAIVKEAGVQAGIEGAQEGVIEYLGETAYTGMKVDPWKMLDRGGAGATAGGIFGGAVRGGTASFEVVTSKRQNTIDEDVDESKKTQDGYKEKLAEAQQKNEDRPAAEAKPKPKPLPEGEEVVKEEQATESDLGESISVADAVKLTGKSRSTIKRRIDAGKIRKVGSKLSLEEVRNEFGLNEDKSSEKAKPNEETETLVFSPMEVELDKLVALHYTGEAKNGKEYLEANERGEVDPAQFKYIMEAARSASEATKTAEQNVEEVVTEEVAPKVKSAVDMVDDIIGPAIEVEAGPRDKALNKDEVMDELSIFTESEQQGFFDEYDPLDNEESFTAGDVEDYIEQKTNEAMGFDPNELGVLESRIVDDAVEAIHETKGHSPKEASVEQVAQNEGFVGNPPPPNTAPVAPEINQHYDPQKQKAVQVNAYGQVITQADLDESARIVADVNSIIRDAGMDDNNLVDEEAQQGEKEPTTLEKSGGVTKFDHGSNYQGPIKVDDMSIEPSPKIKLAGTKSTRKSTKDNIVYYDHVLRQFRKIVGNRIYHTKGLGKQVAGTYDRISGAIRMASRNQVETLGHEFAHWLDFHSSMAEDFQKLYRGNASIKNLSYTNNPKVQNPEGFAEYVRLWLTQYPRAQEHAAQFTLDFEKLIQTNPKLWADMLALQELSHSYFTQGADLQAQGKVGEAPLTVSQRIDDYLDAKSGSKIRQQAQDSVHGVKVMVRHLKGDDSYDLTPSQNPYDLFSFARGGAESVYLSIRDDGTVEFDENGNLVKNGIGLKEVFGPVQRHFGKIEIKERKIGGKVVVKRKEIIVDTPQAMKKNREVWEDFMQYLIARRASELTGQNRENLMNKQNIAAGFKKAAKWQADEGIDFEAVAAEYQLFNDRMIDFYVQSGLISADQKASFKEMNRDYVPFNRIIEGLKAKRDGQPIIGGHLSGGDTNIAEIEENITDGLVANIQQALFKRAERAMFNMLDKDDNGSLFAVRIPAAKVITKVDNGAFAKRLAEVLVQLGVGVSPDGNLVANHEGDTIIDGNEIKEVLEENPHLVEMYSGLVEPRSDETLVKSVIADGSFRESEEGKTIYYEVREPLLIDMLENLGGKSLAAPWQFAIRLKGIQTRTVTAWPEFVIANLVRDTQHAFYVSKRGFIPVVHSLLGMKSYLMEDELYRDMVRNGMMFSGKLHSNVEENRSRQQLDSPSKNYIDSVSKAIAKYDNFMSAFEYGSRLGQAGLARKQKAEVFTQASEGRSVGGDFAQSGNSAEFARKYIKTIPFANAAMVGMTRTAKAMRDEAKLWRDVKKDPAILKKFDFYIESYAAKASMVVVASLVKAAHNRDDERYKALPRHKRLMNSYLSVPEFADPKREIPLISWPKAFELGALNEEFPAIMIDYIAERDGEDTAKAVASVIWHQVGFVTDAPSPFQTTIEHARNKKFTGAPIVPAKYEKLKGKARRMEFGENTAELYQKIGHQFNVSPILLEHYSRGYFRYMAKNIEDVTNLMLWDEKAMGNRPHPDWFGKRIQHKFVEREVPYQTRSTEKFWELRAEADSMRAVQKLIIDEEVRLNNDNITVEFLREKYPEYKHNELVLGAVAPVFAEINNVMGDISTKIREIKYNNDTTDGKPKSDEDSNYTNKFIYTAEEKEEQIEAEWAVRNNIFQQAFIQLEKDLKEYKE